MSKATEEQILCCKTKKELVREILRDKGLQLLKQKNYLVRERKILSYQTTINFEFDSFVLTDELNELLSVDDYECEVFDTRKSYGYTIVQIRTNSRSDAEKYLELVSKWTSEQNLSCRNWTIS
tara:strand:- start:552 stop:920 length:369 start_codon:yes stop_codon:yes gene_type:complete